MKIDDVDVAVRYIPGQPHFGLRMHKDFTCIHVTADPEEFNEFRRQVNFAWGEYEKAQGVTPKPKAAKK